MNKLIFDIQTKKILTSVIFHNLRILNGVTKQDTYIHNYLWHLEREGDEFFDMYSLCFYWGLNHQPKRILEIGPRSGLSLIQLLSSFVKFEDMRVVLFDTWHDGLCNPELIKKHLEHLSIPTDFVEFYTGDSKETVPEFKISNQDKFDWILVDGSHDINDAAIDLENVVDLVADGGVIVMDDIRPQPEESMDLLPVWENFKKKYFDKFDWNEDFHGKGVGWGIKKVTSQKKDEKTLSNNEGVLITNN